MKKKQATKTLRKTLAKAANEVVVAAPQVTRKLDLACGQTPVDGFEGVDIWPGAKHVVNLMAYPWPFADGSVSELHCSHFCEHIPMIFVDAIGNEVPMGSSGAQEAFLRFVDECYRILAPGGTLRIIVPSGRSNRGFQDPTHRRFFVEESFAYLSAEWRKAVHLDHYNVKCNFISNVQTTVDAVLNTRHPDVAGREMRNYWNSTVDFHAICTKAPPLVAAP